jgi:hypothetical protein
MKFKTVAVAAAAGAVGYLLGTKAGRARFEQIKARAGELARDPRVQSGVSSVAGQVREKAHKLPDPVAGVVRTAAEKVETATKQDSGSLSEPSTSGSTGPAATSDTTSDTSSDTSSGTTPGTTTFGTPGSSIS